MGINKVRVMGINYQIEDIAFRKTESFLGHPAFPKEDAFKDWIISHVKQNRGLVPQFLDSQDVQLIVNAYLKSKKVKK